MIPGNTSSQGKFVDAPTSVSASAGNAQATVSFTLPVYDGKDVATYTATSSPSGVTSSSSSSPITVTGLSNGTAYTFTVATVSGYGVSAVSGASSSVSPVSPAPFFRLTCCSFLRCLLSTCLFHNVLRKSWRSITFLRFCCSFLSTLLR